MSMINDESDRICFQEEFIIAALQTIKNFSWLDKQEGWFWINSTKRNRILTIIKKILSVRTFLSRNILVQCRRKHKTRNVNRSASEI